MTDPMRHAAHDLADHVYRGSRRAWPLVLVLAFSAGVHAQQAGVPARIAAEATTPTSPSMAPATRPAWGELTAGQRTALAPLYPHWDTLSENHKRKWIAISRNFDHWSADEQGKLHGRMSAWAGLSTVQRDQARLNYAEARKVNVDEKKARWEAYQALSDEQRDKLAASTAPKRPGVAAPAKLNRGPEMVKLVPSGGDPRSSPRVGVPASAVDHNTLLPQHIQSP
ncbi:DUF3106 domain-containing protein [Xylophilus sp. Kf1]|nr:DUF3106 domain-containing protein [Xylophilus sp. Kf1]